MKLIKNYLSIHLKKAIEYKASFIMITISQAIYMIIELVAVLALFDNFNLLSMFNRNELILGFSTVWLGYSICELFGRGFDNFYKIIVNGNFDLILIRPRNIYLQIFGNDISYEKIGRVLLSLSLYIYSTIKVINNISITKILLLIFMVIGCVIIIISLFILGASFCFISIEGIEFINIFTNGTRQVSQYPLSIYNKTFRFIFTYLIPISLINYYPIKYLNGSSNNIIYLFIPTLTIIYLLISTRIFNLGIKKYTSTGT
ncbi:MAG: ABC-2 family transporter protein [Bacilli bacterium]|nr:ABC-2 family transporter protein [Bacilli bacterium]